MGTTQRNRAKHHWYEPVHRTLSSRRLNAQRLRTSPPRLGKRTLAKLLLALTFLTHACTVQAELSLCLDESDFPPFSFSQPIKPQRTNPIVGYTPTLVTYIEETLNTTISTKRFPWKRCLLMLEHGLVDLVADAYYNDERAQKFSYSLPYYNMTPQIYYLKETHPAGLPQQGLLALIDYLGCGIQGYSYEHYGTGHQRLATDALSQKQLFLQLERKRCDYLVEELEIIEGLALVGEPLLSGNTIEHFRPENSQAPALHFIFNKTSASTKVLIPKINLSIRNFLSSGLASSTMKRLKSSP